VSKYIPNPKRIDVYTQEYNLSELEVNKLISDGSVRAYEYKGILYVNNKSAYKLLKNARYHSLGHLKR